MFNCSSRWRRFALGLVSSLCLFAHQVHATASDDPDVLRRRGMTTLKSRQGIAQPAAKVAAPTLTLLEPFGGWTASQMLRVKGTCTDPNADPILVAINGTRYYVRNMNGQFNRSFPASKGKNNVTVTCQNAAGNSIVERTIDAQIPSVPMKVVLTSDTDGVYTDLHIYEPNGTHVYWAQTRSPTGGLFFLNSDGGSFDQPGYGPYLYTHSAPPIGTFRIDANYWPGGAIQHTLAALDLVLNEGQPNEVRRRVKKPLARPGETATLAFVTFRENGLAPVIYIPGQDDPKLAPKNPPVVKNEDSYQEGALNDLPKPSRDDELMFKKALSMFALQQAVKPSPKWDLKQKDCAGFVRFVYRETLRARSTLQREENRLPKSLPFPVVSDQFRRALPGYPSLWRIPTDRNGDYLFRPFADAEHLVTHNFTNKGRSVKNAEAGDLLVYRRQDDPEQPFHLMLIVAPNPKERLVVYHNGQVGKEAQIRVVPLSDLASVTIPEPAWAPVEQNRYFLGVYTWKVLKRTHQA